MLRESETENECAVCACTDIAREDVDGLSQIRDLQLTKSIVVRIAVSLDVPAVMERISNSRFPTELLLYLPHVYGDKSINLRPAAQFISESGDDFFDEEARTAFAELYCGKTVREALFAQDYPKAWKSILLALPGWTDLAFAEGGWFKEVKNLHEITGLPISQQATARFLNELYAAMRDDDLVPDMPDSLKAAAIAAYFAIRQVAWRIAKAETS